MVYIPIYTRNRISERKKIKIVQVITEEYGAHVINMHIRERKNYPVDVNDIDKIKFDEKVAPLTKHDFSINTNRVWTPLKQ